MAFRSPFRLNAASEGALIWVPVGVLVCWAALMSVAQPEVSAAAPLVNDAYNDAPAGERYGPRVPLLPIPSSWPINDTWKMRPVGQRDFYFVDNGPYGRVRSLYDDPLHRALYETGVLQRTTPGYLPMRFLEWIGDPTGANSAEQELVGDYIENQWPVWSISYATARGLALPPKPTFDRIGDLWLGDGSPEYMTYRLEGVVNYIRSGKLGDFSSSQDTESASWSAFMDNKLIPELRSVLPPAVMQRGFGKKAIWSAANARILSNAFMKTYFEKIGRSVAWGVYLSPYYMAAMPNNVAIGERNSNPLYTAHARGIMRSAGGNKFYLNWQSAEEAMPWRGHFPNNIQTPGNEIVGYDLNHVRSKMWRPFLTGAHYFIFNLSPAGMINDVEQDGHHELNVLGETFHDIMDMADALPDRGVAVASVGLLLDADRNVVLRQHRPTQSYIGLKMRFDAADAMINGLLALLFPMHEGSAGAARPILSAPYGEIFDILSPNQAGKPVSPETFANYKILFDLGGLQVDAQYAQTLKNYVRNGGVLVMNVADLGEHLEPSFFGVSIDSGATKQGSRVKNARTGRRFDEETFTYVPLKAKGAEVLYTTEGNPLVTLHEVGSGSAILVASRFMVQDGKVEDRRSSLSPSFQNRPLLKMVPDFIDQLTAGTMPIELRCAPEDREHLTWWVHKKGDSWLVFVQNFDSRKRFERTAGNLYSIVGDYEFNPIEYQLVSRVPVADVVDLYGRRNVLFEKNGGTTVATDFARYGDIRIYEFSSEPIKLTRSRFINYAMERPVRASHTLLMPRHRAPPDSPKTNRFSPRLAVDGSFDNRRFWQSGRGDDPKAKTWNSFRLPAWLEVDLQQTRTVDHMTIQFRHRPVQDSQDMFPWIVRYTVEVSKNGRKWTTVVDESANAKPLRRRPVTKWFEPVEARYARVTVLSNSERRGAQVVEFGVYGADRERFVAQRNSPWPPERAWFPIDIQNWPESKQVFVADAKPTSIRTMKGENQQLQFAQRNIRTSYDSVWGGHPYTKVLNVSAPHQVTYDIPDDAQTFVAVGGFRRLHVGRPGVIYRVFVDGQKRFDSGEYYGFDALPIVVDVRSARSLSITVEDMRDGIGTHEALLAEPRFLLQ